jgi:hypothetical protein
MQAQQPHKSRVCLLRMIISNEPETSKEIKTLLIKGTAGQQGKSKALGMVICFIYPIFPGFSIG